jgi:mRNA interferase RelE/StbE
MRTLLVTPQFEKDLPAIPEAIKAHANEVVTSLRDNPTDAHLHLKKLNLFGRDFWRARVGNYRIIYTFDQSSLTLHRFRHRKDVYRNL